MISSMVINYFRHLRLARFFLFLSCILSLLSLTSCAYRWGSPDRSLPGGYRQVYIPVFKNLTPEPGIEVDFTNALRREFERSKIARISEYDAADAEIKISDVIS